MSWASKLHCKGGNLMTRTRFAFHFASLATLVLLLGSGSALGHDVNHQGRPPVRADASEVPIKVIDRPVVDQNGISRSFLHDVVGDRVVVADFIYTSCGTLCPLQSAILADLQDRLGGRLGRDVVLLSISVDPVNDQVPRLHEQAVLFGAKPGWLFLTGTPKDVEAILTGMQAWVETPEDHPGFFLVGNKAQAEWRKLDGMPTPAELLRQIDAATAHRHAPAS